MSDDDLYFWRCPKHGLVMLSDQSVRQSIIEPLCPKFDKDERMGVCSRRLYGPVEKVHSEQGSGEFR